MYNIDYILKVFIAGFVFYAGFNSIYVWLEFIDYFVALSNPAIYDWSVCSTDNSSFLEGCELFDVQFDILRNNILAETSKIEM